MRARPAQASRHRVDAIEFRGRLDVETHDVGLQRLLDLPFSLADAREHDLGGITASRKHAGKLTAGNDVEACAQPRQDVEHREVGIRLHRIADQCATAR